MSVQHNIRDQQRDHRDGEFVLTRKVRRRAERNRGDGREVQPPDGIRVAEEPDGDTKYDCGDDEKKRGNHFTESIRPTRYAKTICYSRVSMRPADNFAGT
jgi:hypothetical protein